jgi:hypothetical protein
MEILSPDLERLLEQGSEECFQDNAIVQELVLPALDKWTSIAMVRDQKSPEVMLKCWTDLHRVMDSLPPEALNFGISKTEYLVDILLQHVQIDIFDTDIRTWKLSASCFLLLLENCSATVWQESASTAEDFFDNLIDIYQSTGISRGSDHLNFDGVSSENLSSIITVVELMMAVALKPSRNASSESALSAVIAGCIKDLMFHFRLREKDSGHVDLGQQLAEERNHFIDIIESYLTDTTKNCRTLLLAAAHSMSEKSSMAQNAEFSLTDDVVYLRTDKSTPTNCFTIMLLTLRQIQNQGNLFDYPELVSHILSCHSHLCVVPEVVCVSFLLR